MSEAELWLSIFTKEFKKKLILKYTQSNKLVFLRNVIQELLFWSMYYLRWVISTATVKLNCFSF